MKLKHPTISTKTYDDTIILVGKFPSYVEKKTELKKRRVYHATGSYSVCSAD